MHLLMCSGALLQTFHSANKNIRAHTSRIYILDDPKQIVAHKRNSRKLITLSKVWCRLKVSLYLCVCILREGNACFVACEKNSQAVWNRQQFIIADCELCGFVCFCFRMLSSSILLNDSYFNFTRGSFQVNNSISANNRAREIV